MNKIGIQSMGAVRAGKLEESYRMIREAGFDCVDFNFDEYPGVNDVYAGVGGDSGKQLLPDVLKLLADMGKYFSKQLL